jgi:hypothetical protein
MTDLGRISTYLGIEFEFTTTGLRLHQTKFAQSILDDFGMTEANSTLIPLPDGLKLWTDMEAALVDPVTYQSLVGKLIFLTHTRPDLAYSINLVSRFMHSPQLPHLQAVKSILRHIKAIVSMGLLYKKGEASTLTGFSDADWAGCIDDKRSTGAYLFKLGSTPITWCSRKQPTVVPSSTKSEYRALMKATKESMWLRRILKELGFRQQQTTIIYCDNQGSIKLTKNPLFHARTKHFEVHFHFTREKVLACTISVQFVPTNQQAADILTKSLGRIKFAGCRKLLGLAQYSQVPH